MENLSLIQMNVERWQQLWAAERVPARRAVLRSILDAARTQLNLVDPYVSETDPQKLREESARCRTASRRTAAGSLQKALAQRALALAQRAETRDRTAAAPARRCDGRG